MIRIFGRAPEAAEIETMGRRALAGLPEQFARHLADVVFRVEEFADTETLASVGLDEPWQLSGIYEGVPLHLKSIAQSGTLPDRIRLFRGPILDEWAERGDVSLERLVAHVVIHEVGHHFGLSDADMHALEDAAD
ncbi:MAG: metallopeptidase family protein [Tsuneonella sp.]